MRLGQKTIFCFVMLTLLAMLIVGIGWILRSQIPVVLPDAPLSMSEYRRLAHVHLRQNGYSKGEITSITRNDAMIAMLHDRSPQMIGLSEQSIIDRLGNPHAVRNGSLIDHLSMIRLKTIEAHDIEFSHPGLRSDLWFDRFPELGMRDRLDLVTYDVLEQERAEFSCIPPSHWPWVASKSLVYLTGRMLEERESHCWAQVFEINESGNVERIYTIWAIEGLY